MADLIRNLIQYSGLADQMPEDGTVFKQLNVEQIYCLPDAKPDIEQIVKVITSLQIISTLVIRTPIGVSLEGQVLTGYKLVVEGLVKLVFEYVADEPEQSVHAAHATIPFSTFIVLPADFVIGTPVTAKAYLEDVFTQMTDKRCIFTNITMILTADFCKEES